MQEGLRLAQAGKQSEALEVLNQAVLWDAEYAPAFAARGEVLAAAGKPQSAISDLSRALALTPGDHELLRLRAEQYLLLQQAAAAVQDYQAARQQQPQLDVALELGRAYRLLGNGKEAYTALTEAIERHPDLPAARLERGQAALMMQDDQAAEEDFSYLIEVYQPEDRHQQAALLERGNLRLRQGRLEKAEADFSKLLKQNSISYPALLGRSEVYLRQHRLAAAQADIGKALKFSQEAKGLKIAGLIALEQGRMQDAITQLQKATDKAPQEAHIWLELGKAWLLEGTLEQAGPALSEAIKLDRNLDEAFHQRAIVLLRADQPEAALPDIERALHLQPQQADYYLTLAEIEQALGDSAAAQHARQQAVELSMPE